jgi:hypothetical protein
MMFPRQLLMLLVAALEDGGGLEGTYYSGFMMAGAYCV